MKACRILVYALCALGVAACSTTGAPNAATGASASGERHAVIRDTGWPNNLSYPSTNRAPGAP